MEEEHPVAYLTDDSFDDTYKSESSFTSPSSSHNTDQDRQQRQQQQQEEADQPRQRLLQECTSGCIRLDGKVTGANEPFGGTGLVSSTEFNYPPFDVEIRAADVGPGCVAGDGVVLQFNMTDPDVSPNIGAPNVACTTNPGPGVGSGGAPTLPDGTENPFANCPTPGQSPYVAFTVAGPGTDFGGCTTGFKLIFDFMYPVQLNKVGLIDVVEDDSVRVDVEREDGTILQFNAKGTGPNSFQNVGFKGLRRVVSMTVVFATGGAVQYVDYCHVCGAEDTLRETLVDEYYPDPSVRQTDNQDSVSRFESLLPSLTNFISSSIETAIDTEYRSRPGHCLEAKTLGVHVMLNVSTAVEASRCNGTFGVED